MKLTKIGHTQLTPTKRSTLWELFYRSPDAATEIPWKIFDVNTKKMICKNYACIKSDDLDNAVVHSIKLTCTTNMLPWFAIYVEL